MLQTRLVKCEKRNFNVSKFGTGSSCNKACISLIFDARSGNAKTESGKQHRPQIPQ